MIVELFQIIHLPGGYSVIGPIPGALGQATLGGIISIFIPIILTIAGILTFIWLIIGGFRLLFSGGDPKAIAGARDNITFALIGLAIVFAAWWLTLIVQRALDICIVGEFLGIGFGCIPVGGPI